MKVQTQGTKKPCCEQQRNLQEVPTEKRDLRLFVCQRCFCRHFVMTADPGEVGLELGPASA